MRRIIAPLILGLAGAAVLVGLGLWQLERLEWKRGVLDRIAARIEAEPVPVWEALAQADPSLAPVWGMGRIGPQELFVLVSTKSDGAGWRVIAPFEVGGRRLLLDRGFIPVDQRDAPRPAQVLRVEGNLHWPDDRNSATPPNDVAGNIWYARDVDQMAEVLGTEPVLMVARTPTGQGVRPMPVSAEFIPNDHLEYAITWFLLAAAWLGMTALWLWRIYRRNG